MKNIQTIFAVAVFAALLITAIAPNAFGQGDKLKFDSTLGTDFAAGMGGDAAALTKAFERADKILAANPNDAGTLVWHGSATLAVSGKAFQSGNYAEGWELWQKGLKEMDRAVEIAPDDFTVRIVRGSTTLNAARHYPDPNTAKELRQKTIMDFEKILSLTDEQSVKAAATQKSKILTGLTEAYDKLGDKTKADFYRAQTAAPVK